MDIASVIVGIIIILIILTPFAIIKINSGNKQKAQLQTLFSFVEENGCSLSQFDLWNNVSIGIDEISRKLFFVRNAKEADIFQLVNLNEISKCQVINSSRTLNNKEGIVKIVDKLKLTFTPLDKNKPDIILECYNVAFDNLTLSGELQLVDKWCTLSNSKLPNPVKQK